MNFSVNYLGASVTQVGLNFSRPAAQILAQYYNFLHLGMEGYRKIHSNSMAIANYCHEAIGQIPCFQNYSQELENPLFIWSLKPEYDRTAKWTLYDLQDKLKQNGWMVPAYTLPATLEETIVMRIVVRQGFSRDMADQLLGDIKDAVAELDKLQYPTPSRLSIESNIKVKGTVYTHTGKG
jgi:glutamate decarboxylase